MTESIRPPGSSAAPASERRQRNHRRREAEAIKQCLIYLESEAVKLGLELTSHLIGVAAATVEGSISAEVPARSSRSADGRIAALRGKSGGRSNGVQSIGFGPKGTKTNGSGNGVDE